MFGTTNTTAGSVLEVPLVPPAPHAFANDTNPRSKWACSLRRPRARGRQSRSRHAVACQRPAIKLIEHIGQAQEVLSAAGGGFDVQRRLAPDPEIRVGR